VALTRLPLLTLFRCRFLDVPSFSGAFFVAFRADSPMLDLPTFVPFFFAHPSILLPVEAPGSLGAFSFDFPSLFAVDFFRLLSDARPAATFTVSPDSVFLSSL